MNFETYEYTIPTFYLCVLINGDTSGLTDEEERELDSFLGSVPVGGHWDCEEHGFNLVGQFEVKDGHYFLSDTFKPLREETKQ